jgi:pentatricopeptide repeat protein
MYAKCGMLGKAEEVMKQLPVQNIVSWSTLVAGYADLNQGHEALECFGRMQIQGMSPNTVTYISLLKACGRTGALELGKTIHDEVVHGKLLDKDIALGNAVVDMYARCDMLAKARDILEGLPTRNVVTWNALIAGYAQQGQGHEALKCFEQMQSEGMHPNDVTFVSMLCACGHSGLSKETGILFESMTLHYGITPNLKHQTCMVVVFGFKGQFDNAISVIKAMPSPASRPDEDEDPSVWLALLNACKKWGNVELGRSAFDQTMQLNQGCAAAYVFMANIFTVRGMREDAESIEDMRIKYETASKYASHNL